MLKWVANLSKKSEHPMSQLNEARKLLADLPLHDAFKTLSEITSWLESISYASGFKLDKRIEIIQLLEEVGSQSQRKLRKAYLIEAHTQRYQEQRVWSAIFNFYKALGVAYVLCIKQYQGLSTKQITSKASLLFVCARALRALAKQIKWQQMRYGPIDLQLWNDIAKIYSLAENYQISKDPVSHPSLPTTTSIEQEFIKPLVLAVAAPGSLLPHQFEIADKIITHFSRKFLLKNAIDEKVPYCFSLTKPRRPVRYTAGVLDSEKLRFFGIGTVEAGLVKLEEILKKGTIPEEINLDGAYRAFTVLQVVRHLIMQLSNKAALRKHNRRKITVTLNVVYGYTNVLQSIQNPNHIFRKTKENWIIENISLGGFSALIPNPISFNIRVGSLLSLWTNEGVYWGIGVIRHLVRNHDQHGQVGIQSLSQAAQAITLRPLLADRKWRGSGENGDIEGESFPAALLVGAARTEGETHLLLQPGSFNKSYSLEMQLHGKKRLLQPIDILEKGEDYEVARFKDMEYKELIIKAASVKS